MRLLQEIPLGEAEQAAVEDGVSAYENLLSKLPDVTTPAGLTQRQIGAGLVQSTFVRPALPTMALKFTHRGLHSNRKDERTVTTACLQPDTENGLQRPTDS